MLSVGSETFAIRSGFPDSAVAGHVAEASFRDSAEQFAYADFFFVANIHLPNLTIVDPNSR